MPAGFQAGDQEQIEAAEHNTKHAPLSRQTHKMSAAGGVFLHVDMGSPDLEKRADTLFCGIEKYLKKFNLPIYKTLHWVYS